MVRGRGKLTGHSGTHPPVPATRRIPRRQKLVKYCELANVQMPVLICLGSENLMKRQIPSVALITSILLLLCIGLTPRGGARVLHPRRSAHDRKTSSDLSHRISLGRGG